MELKGKYDVECKEKSALDTRCSEMLSKLSAQERELQQLNTNNATLLCQLQITKSENSSVSSSSAVLSQTVEQKNRDIQNLKEQINALEDQISNMRQTQAGAQLQTEEATTLKANLEHRFAYFAVLAI